MQTYPHWGYGLQVVGSGSDTTRAEGALEASGGGSVFGLKHCPVCRTRVRNFWPTDNGRRQAVCPSCRCAERHRHLWLYLERATGLLDSDARMLHWAPEPAIKRRLQAVPTLRYETADLDPDVGVDHVCSITDNDLPSDAYDAILCFHVLEHIPDDAAAMATLIRLLRPGGTAFVQVPMFGAAVTDEDPAVTDPDERRRRWGRHDHVRQYGDDLDDRLAAAGFEVHVDLFRDQIPPWQRRRYGLVNHLPDPWGTQAREVYGWQIRRCVKP